MQGLLDEVLSAGREMDLPDVLRRVVTAGTELVDARYGAFGVVDRHQVITEFVPVGTDEAEAARIGRLPTGHGLLGELIRRPEPLRLSELGEHPSSSGVPAGHPQMHSFLGVPVRVGGEVFGILYLTEKRGDTGFTEGDETLAELLAAAAGAAVESARRHADARLAARLAAATAEVTSLALAGDTPRRLMDRVAELARAAVTADLALVLRPASPATVDGLEVLAAVGEGADRFLGVRLPQTAAFPVSVLATGKAATVPDLAHDPAAEAPAGLWAGLGSAVALPLPSSGGPGSGLLLLARAKPAAALPGMERAAWSPLADAAALAWEVASGPQAAGEPPAEGAERQVAGELRSLAARLSGTERQAPASRTSVQAYDDARVRAGDRERGSVTRRFRPATGGDADPPHAEEGLRVQVTRAVHEAASRLGFAPEVTLTGAPDDVVPAAATAVTVSVLTDALSLLSRARQVNRIEVLLRIGTGRLVASVRSDSTAGAEHLGEALRQGRGGEGQLSVTTSDGMTTVLWRLDITPARGPAGERP
ncbi:GAF domain-containing protein [Streptomyces sp. NPDC059740]|uniref:GAF domain-containing protein n=1 Tax=Streptomyces sp. NPDC059740 TaxID=3346926 RepID=UPI0036529BC1